MGPARARPHRARPARARRGPERDRSARGGRSSVRSWRAADPISNDDLPEAVRGRGPPDGLGPVTRKSSRCSAGGREALSAGSLIKVSRDFRILPLSFSAARAECSPRRVYLKAAFLAAMGYEVVGRRGRVPAQRDEGVISSPSVACGAPTTAASATAGWAGARPQPRRARRSSRRAGSAPSCARRSSRIPRASAWRGRPS